MKSFKVQFFNKNGNIEEVFINADTVMAVKKDIFNRVNFSMLICLKLV